MNSHVKKFLKKLANNCVDLSANMFNQNIINMDLTHSIFTYYNTIFGRVNINLYSSVSLSGSWWLSGNFIMYLSCTCIK